jgi:hypothetical protein
VWCHLFFGIKTPGEDESRRIQIEFLIRPGKALQKPTTEKTCSAGNEYALVAQFVPETFSAVEDVVEVIRKWIISVQ